MNIPGNLKYTDEHEWIAVEGDVATIGITDYAQGELGDLVFIELPEVGDQITLGESFGTVEAVKAVSDLFAPLSGSVVEINEILADDPETVNKDPYEDGWMIKIKIGDKEELSGLLGADAYKDLVA